MDSNYCEIIAKKILLEPLRGTYNRLCILVNTATPSMISWVLSLYKKRKMKCISIELIIASISEHGIDSISHNGFKTLHTQNNFCEGINISCSYLCDRYYNGKNLYIWMNDNDPIKAFETIYDFSQISMLRKHETYISECDPEKAYSTYEEMEKNSIFCNHNEIEEYICIYLPNCIIDNAVYDLSSENVRLSLLSRNGEIGKRSGLNWGQRKGRNKNEAYIHLPKKVAESGFFPLNKQHFLVLTDDRHLLQLRVAQENDKAITTPASNAQLGEYFRNRLNLANGAYVHKNDLLSYGRTDVTFYKIDEEQFFMDFSPESRGWLYGR